MQEHIAWLKKQLQQCIDDGYSESWVYAYQLAIDNAESMLEKEKEQIAEAESENSEAFADGYSKGYDRALELVKWALSNLIPPYNKQ